MDAEESVALVIGALAGDRGALERLVKVLTPVIQSRVARTLLGCGRGGRNLRQGVEDLTQEVFLKLFAHDGRELRRWKLERGLSLENFVGLVAERHTLSYLRSARRTAAKEEPTPSDELDRRRDEPGPERRAAVREQLQLLLARLGEKLSPLGVRMFELLFVQDLSTEEAMAATGLSRDAADAWRSRLRRLARE